MKILNKNNMTASDYLKCVCFFVIGSLSAIFDVATLNGFNLAQMNWIQLGAPIFILGALKSGMIALLAYVMKSPVPTAGSWFKEDPATGDWTKEEQHPGSAPADVEAASVTPRRKFVPENKE